MKFRNNKKINRKTLVLSIIAICLVFFGSFIFSLNFNFDSIKNIINPFSKVQAQTSALYLTNIHVSTINHDNAVIHWETNEPSDSLVNIGTTSDYEMPNVSSSVMERIHRLTVSGLEAKTTYHYQVVSQSEDGEVKTSVDRTFTTSEESSTTSTTALTVESMQVEANYDRAQVSLTASSPSQVTIFYDTSSQTDSSGYTHAQSTASYAISSTIYLSGLFSDTDYYYRARIEDASGSSFVSGEFEFKTNPEPPPATMPDSTKFNAGCGGGILIGDCSGTSYCDPGAAALIKRCDKCGYACPEGETCRTDGTCVSDPTVNVLNYYQCNSPQCYDINGNFISPAVDPGCNSSYPRCNANTVLKVARDRECAKWLTCGTAIEQTNPETGQSEELCMNLAVCTSLGESGQCTSYANLPQVQETYRMPEEADKIRWLSGSINAGLDWRYEKGSPVISGYYPWSSMSEVGGKLKIKNWNFEETKIIQAEINSDKPGLEDVKTYDIAEWSDNFIKYPNKASNNTDLESVWDPSQPNKENRCLKVGSMDGPGQGVSILAQGSTATASKYVANLRIKSSDSASQRVDIRLSSGGSDPTIHDFGTYLLTTGWQQITTPAIDGLGKQDTYIQVVLNSNSDTQAFYIDDLKLEPVLEVKDDFYLKRSCRLYPEEDSMSCEYFDDNGIYHKGWYGYCLDWDPKNENKCISWWPVDILKYEDNIFGQRESAGYTGRQPVYMCMESEGGDSTLERVVDNSTDSWLGWNVNYLDECASGQEYGIDSEDDLPTYPQFDSSDYDFAICNQTGGVEQGYSLTGSEIAVLPIGEEWAPDDASCDHLAAIDGDETPAGYCYGVIEYMETKHPEYHYLSENVISYLSLDTIANWDEGILWSFISSGGEWPVGGLTFDGDKMYGDYYDSEVKGPTNKRYRKRFVDDGKIYWRLRAHDENDLVFFLIFECLDNSGVVRSCSIDDRGQLTAMAMWGDDNTPSDAEVSSYRVNIELRERCNKLAKVVTDGGGNMAWAETINSSNYKVSDLNYLQSTDLNPYGGAVMTNPENLRQHLLVEEPNRTDFSFPFQERAGKPYACVGDCNNRRCYGGGALDGNPCRSNLDCVDDTDLTQIKYGTCVGVGICKKSDENCYTDDDCGGEDYCIGGAASNRGEQEVMLWPTTGRCDGDRLGKECNTDDDCNVGEECYHTYFAENRIRSLFALSYGIYEWDQTNGRYSSISDSDSPLVYHSKPGWGPPNRVCADGIRPDYDPLNPDTYCGFPPKITNIKLGDGTSNTAKLGKDGGKVKLSFNTEVDRQQQPLKNIWIDWGDDTIDQVNYGYKSKSDPNNPHIYTHAYQAEPSGVKYNIKIAIEDNWGWCSSAQDTNYIYYGTCDGGSRDGLICDEIPIWPFDAVPDCPYGNCTGVYTCDLHPTSTWTPISTCQGGTCQDGICSGGLDDGRSCTPLIVDLTD